ncbi:MAG: Flp family type IVb pilin [Acidimicrobiales bacterium]
MPTTPSTPPLAEEQLQQLYVTDWEDPIVDRLGHDPRSRYVEKYWLGVLGPSCIWLLRWCRDELQQAPEGFVLDLAEAAGSLGLGHNGGRNSPVARTIARACRFGAMRTVGVGQLEVRRRLPPLSPIQLRRLPDALQRRHQVEATAEQQPCDVELRRRAAGWRWGSWPAVTVWTTPSSSSASGDSTRRSRPTRCAGPGIVTTATPFARRAEPYDPRNWVKRSIRNRGGRAEGMETVHRRSGGDETTQGSPPEMTTAFKFLSAWITAHIDDERGASLVEYALLVALIAVVCIAAVTALGKSASEKFSEVDSAIG